MNVLIFDLIRFNYIFTVSMVAGVEVGFDFFDVGIGESEEFFPEYRVGDGVVGIWRWWRVRDVEFDARGAGFSTVEEGRERDGLGFIVNFGL